MARRLTTCTLVFQDNPLSGPPGQGDVTITISSDPDLPLLPSGEPDVEQLTTAEVAAIEALSHVAGMAASAAMVVLKQSNEGRHA